MQTKVFQKIAHPWLLGVSLLMVGIFVGAGFEFAKAQTAAFTEPTCNPGEACNPNGTPILTTSNTSQTISSPLLLNGNITLGDANQLLRTNTSATNSAINVLSSNNYAIVGKATNSAYAGIQGIGSNGAYGIFASTDTGTALYAAQGSGARAAWLDGKVEIGSPTKVGDLLLSNGSLSISGTDTGTGKLTAKEILATSSLTVSGNLIVNGSPVVSGEMRQTVLTANVAASPGNKAFSAAEIFGTGNQYKLMGLQFFRLYPNTGTYPKTWTAAAPTYTYTECTNSSTFSGQLVIAGTANAASYRVIATYRTETVNCNTTDYENPVATITSPSTNGNVAGTYTVTASVTDNVAVTKLELYVNGVLKVTNTSNPAGGQIQYDFTPFATSPASQVTISMKAYDAAGNVGISFPVIATVQSALCSGGCAVGSACTNCACNGVDNWMCVASGVSCATSCAQQDAQNQS